MCNYEVKLKTLCFQNICFVIGTLISIGCVRSLKVKEKKKNKTKKQTNKQKIKEITSKPPQNQTRGSIFYLYCLNGLNK